MQSHATVYVASKNFKGKWAARPVSDAVVVDVTSAQAKASANRLAFSPMHMGDASYVSAEEGTFANFEAYWQSLKVVEGLDHAAAKTWWRGITKAKRRHPKMAGKKAVVLGARHERFPGKLLGYVESRKKVYVPDYHAWIKDKSEVAELRARAQAGTPLVVYDFDGPRDEDKEPIAARVTVELLRQKIADQTTPFGHGYVVAATILGIAPDEYCV